MNFVLIDGTICVASRLTCNVNNTTSVVAHNKTITTGNRITGEMCLFRKNSLPDIFRDDGVVRTMEVEFIANNSHYTINDLIFISRKPMKNAYEKCDAALFEYEATDFSVTKIQKHIDNKITL